MIDTTYIRNETKLKMDSKIMLKVLRVASIMLLALLPCSVSAQFINIKIDIPPKTGMSNNVAFETDQDGTSNSENDYEGRIFALGLSCVENLHILATLENPVFLQNEQGDSIKLSSTLTYRNDGKSSLPKARFGNRVFFPMSDSNRLIDDMEDAPQQLNAYIFINTDTGVVPNTTSIFTGEIKLTIEYN